MCGGEAARPYSRHERLIQGNKRGSSPTVREGSSTHDLRFTIHWLSVPPQTALAVRFAMRVISFNLVLLIVAPHVIGQVVQPYRRA